MKDKVRSAKGRSGAYETQDPPPGGGGGKQAGYPTVMSRPAAKKSTASRPAKAGGSSTSKTKTGAKPVVKAGPKGKKN